MFIEKWANSPTRPNNFVVNLGAKRCRDSVLFCLAHICPPPSSTGKITSRHLRQGEIFWKVVRHCPPQDGPPQTILDTP
jgi:hypothetical protein